MVLGAPVEAADDLARQGSSSSLCGLKRWPASGSIGAVRAQAVDQAGADAGQEAVEHAVVAPCSDSRRSSRAPAASNTHSSMRVAWLGEDGEVDAAVARQRAQRVRPSGLQAERRQLQASSALRTPPSPAAAAGSRSDCMRPCAGSASAATGPSAVAEVAAAVERGVGVERSRASAPAPSGTPRRKPSRGTGVMLPTTSSLRALRRRGAARRRPSARRRRPSIHSKPLALAVERVQRRRARGRAGSGRAPGAARRRGARRRAAASGSSRRGSTRAAARTPGP